MNKALLMSFLNCKELFMTRITYLVTTHPFKSYITPQALHNMPRPPLIPSACWLSSKIALLLLSRSDQTLLGNQRFLPASEENRLTLNCLYIFSIYAISSKLLHGVTVLSDQIYKTLYDFCWNAAFKSTISLAWIVFHTSLNNYQNQLNIRILSTSIMFNLRIWQEIILNTFSPKLKSQIVKLILEVSVVT